MNVNATNWLWHPYLFQLTKDIIWDSEKKDVNYTSADGMLIIVNGVWTIKKGFKWNGTTAWTDSPYLPDGEIVPFISLKGHRKPVSWMQTLLHDVGCIYVDSYPLFPYTRSEIDRYFYIGLKKIGFKNEYMYYIAVRSFSIVRQPYVSFRKLYKQFTN